MNFDLNNSIIKNNEINDKSKRSTFIKKAERKNINIKDPTTILFLSISKFSIYLIKLFYKFFYIIYFNIWPQFINKEKFSK